jgi:asparagine synthase (glutamine-hydrolysing)
MCGICGGLSWKRPLEAETLQRMLATLVHRGPDDEGAHIAAPVALGARRLSIIDLEAGHQPLSNEDETVWVAQNGEIYNYVELREELEARGHRFRTQGDTEVLAHLYEEHGADFVDKLVGMFAIAIWDVRAEKLVIVRDRLGQKPLYYAPRDDGLVFASEIKALLAAGDISRELDHGALGEYLTKLYIGGERTAYKAIRKLPAAHRMTITRNGIAIERYWDPWAVRPRSGMLVEDDLVEELGELLRDAVRLRLRSDVPLGCFLSGGIDSSLITALACEMSSSVKTFTVGFEKADYDEAGPAKLLAERLGTEHHEYRVADGPDELVRRIPEMFDEPFADSSALPTWQVSKMTRQEVTVALSGDGGDEVFGGYRRYLARRMAARYNRLPRSARRVASGLAALLGEPGDYYGGSFRKKLRMFTAYAAQMEKKPGASRLDFFTPEMQKELLAAEVSEAVMNSAPGEPVRAANLDPVDLIMRVDLEDYLPDDILVKVDRTSMDVSLEARAPLLDHRVVEFMLSLPVEWKLRGKTGKYLLKKLAERVLPREVVHRPKHGFAISLHSWFLEGSKGHTLLNELAASKSMRELVRTEAVGNLLTSHGAGKADLSEHLWSLVVLGLWLGACKR